MGRRLKGQLQNQERQRERVKIIRYTIKTKGLGVKVAVRGHKMWGGCSSAGGGGKGRGEREQG